MTQSLPLLGPDDLHDVAERWPVRDTTVLAESPIVQLESCEIEAPDGAVLSREVVRHPGAVAVVAIDGAEEVDGDDGGGDPASVNVVLVRQFRNAVGHRMIEIPAGLLDVDDEPYQTAAARELAEETGLAAARWNVLVDIFTSPGMTDESVRVFLARDLSPAGLEYEREGEEAHMDVVRAPLSDLVSAVLAGRLHNTALVTGVLAAQATLAGGCSGLRAADAPWPAREAAKPPRS